METGVWFAVHDGTGTIIDLADGVRIVHASGFTDDGETPNGEGITFADILAMISGGES